MRALRILGWLLGGLLGLLVLLALGIWLLVDPNDHKDRIAAAVQRATGRELQIEGDLRLSLWPRLALDLGRTSLGNPAGFPAQEPFAVVEQVRAGVALWPLLRRELEVDRVLIRGLDLRLRRDDAGRGNWEGFGRSDAAPDAAAAPGERGLASLRLQGLSLVDSRVRLDELAVEDLQLEVGAIAPGASTPLEFSLRWRQAEGAAALPLSGRLALRADLDAQRYQAADLALQGQWKPAAAPAPLDLVLEVPALDVDLAAHRLAPAAFSAQLGGAKLSGELGGDLGGERGAGGTLSRRLAGTLQLQPLALRSWLASLGVAPPVMRDAGTLRSLGLQTRWQYGDGELQLEDLDARLDDSHLQGQFALDLTGGGKRFALQVDQLDLDRYLPPPVETVPGQKPGLTLPVEPLRELRAQGTLAIGRLSASGLRLSAVQLGLQAEPGIARIKPLRARFYGGQHDGAITLDVRPREPLLRVEQTLTGIDVAAVLKDYASTQRLSGRGNVSISLEGRGRSGEALVRSLRGTVAANLADGGIEGVDLSWAIAQAQSLALRRTLAADANTKRTPFERLEARAEITDGVARFSTLAAHSRLLRLDGGGTTNLATQALDLKLRTTLLKAPTGDEAAMAGLALATIPVNVTGTLLEPKVRPDLAGLVRARAQQELRERREEVEQKVRDKLQDRLKDLFRR